MLKALTFLGPGPKDGYQTTIYRKHDENISYKTHLFPEAVVELYKPEKTFLLITSKVEEDERGYLKYLSEKLGSKLQVIKIPDGNSEVDLWKIFEICADSVDPNDEIILDITHAFRSIPLLIFIVAAYLRQVKQVKLKYIIYGAFEARAQDTNQTPIFDLTPFVELLDWMNAVNVFQNSGDARPIADLNVDSKIAKALTRLSDALLTNRTLEAQNAAFDFNGLNFNSSQAPPFQMLIDQLKKSYQQMAVYDPTGKPRQSLKAQYQQIKWYVENQHYLQVITLMREWLISWKCIETDQNRWLNKDSRDNVEDNLNARANQGGNQLAAGLAQLAPDQSAIDLWAKCQSIRNDLAHCGMRYKPQISADAIEAIQNLFKEFEEFAKENNIA